MTQQTFTVRRNQTTGTITIETGSDNGTRRKLDTTGGIEAAITAELDRIEAIERRVSLAEHARAIAREGRNRLETEITMLRELGRIKPKPEKVNRSQIWDGAATGVNGETFANRTIGPRRRNQTYHFKAAPLTGYGKNIYQAMKSVDELPAQWCLRNGWTLGEFSTSELGI